MTYFFIVPLLGGIFNLALALFVYVSDRRSRLNQVFFGWALSIAIWNFGTFALFRTPAPLANDPVQAAAAAATALQWATLMQCGVIFIPVTMLHLCLILAGVKPGKWLPLIYCFHGVLVVMNVFGHFIDGVQHVGFAWYSKAGIGFRIYGIAFVQSFASIIILAKSRAALPERERGRFNGILAAQALLVLLGTNDLLPIYGIKTYPYTQTPIFPYGSLAAVAYGLMVAYSVFQHQFLDVRFTLGRWSAYIVRFLFLVLIAVLLELTVATFAKRGDITPFALLSSIAVLIVSTLLASFLFPKLLGGTAETLEQKLMGDMFEYRDKVHAFIERSRWHTDLDALLTDLHAQLINSLGIRGYSLVLRDETNRAFTVVRSHPKDTAVLLSELGSESPVFQYFLSTDKTFLSLAPRYIHGNLPVESAAREQVKVLPGVFAFPFLLGQQPLGLLVVDEKANGRPFTKTDIQLLTEITTNIALVINQVSLKDQLLQAKELELLGRMSQGMAHDLNNLTTPVWTLLQLLTEGVSPEALRTDLAPVAMRNIQTMREYIREALFFSENLRPDFQSARLDTLVQEVVELARQNKRKGKEIVYTLHLSGEIPVEMDRVLIRRLLSNILSNAVDASQPGGRIDIEILRLMKTDLDRDWFRVRITDHGSGIASENIHRIFQPYFTTKKTGDEERGFGLGLAICRKIATLHGGSLVLSSEVGKGTVVNLDLPSRYKALKAARPSSSPAIRERV